MDFSEGPAALGGIMMCVALSAWAFGRWQGNAVAEADRQKRARSVAGSNVGKARLRTSFLRGASAATTAARAETPTPKTARIDRTLALGAVGPLGELHAEMTAYRRAEQVLAGFDGEWLARPAARSVVSDERRSMALLDETSCGITEGDCVDCACSPLCTAKLSARPAPRLRQPLAPLSGFTRV